MKFLKVIYVIKSVYCNVWYNYRFFLYMIKKKNMDKWGIKGIYGLCLKIFY